MAERGSLIEVYPDGRRDELSRSEMQRALGSGAKAAVLRNQMLMLLAARPPFSRGA
jgi:hypothetical protein